MRHYRLITSPESIASLKMRLYLQRRNIAFREVSASRLILKSEILPRLKRIDIPVLVTPSNETVQDTRAMIDHLESREPGDGLLPDDSEGRIANRLIEMFADDWLSPTASFAVWSAESPAAATELAATLYPEHEDDMRARVSRRLHAQVRARLGRQGLIDKTWPSRAARIGDLSALLERHFEVSPFLLGGLPSIADCALAAPFQFLWNETEFGIELLSRLPRLSRWMHAMHGGSVRPAEASRSTVNEATLLPILRFAAEQTLPHALGACEAVADWAGAHPGRINLPRSVGNSAAKRDPEKVSREYAPATAWMLQRLLDALDDAAPAAFELIDASGCGMLERYRPRRTLRHEHHRFRLNIDPDPDAAAIDVHALAEPLLKARNRAVETRDLERLVLG
ncbi:MULTISPECIES: glutathione S-transferase family protein [Hyphobacterium]|uniref:Glutathione S-transferase family protein n=1 Tax=Hyphobacterium vulgare TaxID=1736751 RepID=A0ABV6ZT49_9PROT